ISRLSRELEDKGLVARVPDPQDSRAMLVSLTRKGRELQSKMLPQSIACDRFLLQGLDRQKLVALLTKLDQNLLVLLENSGAVPDQDS
ncbi:MarR family winged helix-turn-helix transcriptional regulator, partial [Bradyrhizobium sp.]|nr:hypothetical protein [Bradyrhizobium sp.]